MGDIFSDSLDVSPKSLIPIKHSYQTASGTSGFSWGAVIAILVIVIIIIFLVPQLVSFSKTLKNPTEGFTTTENVKKVSRYPFDKCLVINLVSTTEGKRRWDLIKEHPQIKDIAIRYPAIYGKEYDYSKLVEDRIITETWDYGRWNKGKSKIVKMDPGEIGCILSHYFLWKKITDNKIPVSLVLEDDAIDMQADFIAKITEEMKYLPKNWDVFLLGFWMHTGKPGLKINSHIYKVQEFAFTHSYIISLRGARKLLRILPINMPIDSWMSSKASQINIYRHNITKHPGSKYPNSSLIKQNSRTSEILHTNNWRQ